MDSGLKGQLILTVPVMLHTIIKSMMRRQDALLKRFGLSAVHAKYLMALDRKPSTLRELSENLDFDKANTTRAIATLRKGGFVADDRETENSKKFTILLTDSGKEIVKILKNDIDSAMDRYFDGTPDEDIGTCIELCRKVYENATESDLDPLRR